MGNSYIQRAESLPSNSDSQENEREYVLNVLRENDFPKRFLNDCLSPPVCKNELAMQELCNNSIHPRCHRTNQENLN
jgi:hypothetical protein